MSLGASWTARVLAIAWRWAGDAQAQPMTVLRGGHGDGRAVRGQRCASEYQPAEGDCDRGAGIWDQR